MADPIRRHTPKEMLEYLIQKVAEHEGRLSQLEQDSDFWDAEWGGPPEPSAEGPKRDLELARERGEGDDGFAVIDAGDPAPGITRRGEHYEFPPDWDEYSAEQQAAWLRTVADGGTPGPPERESRTVEVDIGGGVGVQFPVPSAEAKDHWASTAREICENYAPSKDSGGSLTPEQAEDAYTKGGPLWLAAYDHVFLMGLPQAWRQAMVESVATYAPREAAELGRDILRHDTESAKQVALGYIMDEKDKLQRGGSNMQVAG